MSGGLGLVPGTFSFGEKLLPLFLLSRKLGFCLGDKKPPCSTSSGPGVAFRMFFLCRPGFTCRQSFGAGCFPRRCRAPVPFFQALFFGPARRAGEPGSSGPERGERLAGVFPAGSRAARAPPPAVPTQPAFSSAAARLLPETPSPSRQRREQAFCTRETSCSSHRHKERRKFN